MIPGRVDIVIPLFNQEQFIAECLNSALNQTYSNKTITVVNDGSTDRSIMVVKEIIDDWMRPDAEKHIQCEAEIQVKGAEFAARRVAIWEKYFPNSHRKITDCAVGYNDAEGALWKKATDEITSQKINDIDKWDIYKVYFPNGERKTPIVIDQENRGLSESRNTAIRAGDGEFILPLDADDWIEPTYLEKTVPKMSDPKVGIVSTDMQYEGLLHNRIPPKGLSLAAEMASNDLPVCSLMRREAFEQTKGYETIFIDVVGSTKILGYEDWNMWLDILKRGWTVSVVSEPLFHYRVKPVSMITQASKKHAGLVRLVHLLHPDLWPNG